MLLAGAGVISVVFLKFFTDLAIPGWATSAATGFAIILMQAFFISLFLIFIVLNYRMQRLIVPAVDYKDFILTVEKTGKDANAPHMHTPFPHVTG
jgi:polyisoprenyl-phosphate glycosyltransferase